MKELFDPVTTDPKGEAHTQVCRNTLVTCKKTGPKEVIIMLNPWFVTELVDGEGCFSISFSIRKRLNLGIETRPSFSLSLNIRDLALIQALHQFFQCGSIRFSRTDNTYKFEVRSISDLVKFIVPHFKTYALKGNKRHDFERFDQICSMMQANLHLNRVKLLEIIELACEMNPCGKRKYSKSDLLRVLDK